MGEQSGRSSSALARQRVLDWMNRMDVYAAAPHAIGPTGLTLLISNVLMCYTPRYKLACARYLIEHQ